jgi:CRP/FNR family transcriptional regulator
MSDLDPAGVALLDQVGATQTFAPGQAIMQPGDDPHQIAFVIAGQLRVHKISASGRDLTLYRMEPGQACVLTALSMLTGMPFTAHVTASEPTTIVSVPRRAFDRLYADQPAWRRYVLSLLSDRVGELLELIDAVLFTDLPTRLADVLVTQQHARVVHATHEQLAAEIGSSREVVSRVLKAWENQGTVSLSRGQVTIQSLDSLRRFLVR